MSAPQWKHEMANRFAVWDEIIAAAAACKTQPAANSAQTHPKPTAPQASQIS
jgi:hypothetical protein